MNWLRRLWARNVFNWRRLWWSIKPLARPARYKGDEMIVVGSVTIIAEITSYSSRKKTATLAAPLSPPATGGRHFTVTPEQVQN